MTQNVLSFIVYALELCGIIQPFLDIAFVVYLSRLTLIGSYLGFGLVQLVLAFLMAANGTVLSMMASAQ